MLKKLHFKSVLLLFALIVGVGNAWGDSFTWDLKTNTASSSSGETITWSNNYATMTVTKNGGTNVDNYLGTSNQTRFYNKNILTISPASGYTISSIAFTATSSSYIGGLSNPVWNNASKSVSEAVLTITPTNGTSAVSVTINATVRLQTVSVTYSSIGGSGTAVATPTFSPAAGIVASGTTVTLTQNDAAYIIYTTDGTEPSWAQLNGEEYTTPISITKDTTIKAIAVDDEENESAVVSATYYVQVPGYTVNFETGDLACYTDWEFSNIAKTTSTITAHGGTYYGKTTGTASAAVQTKNKVAAPGLLKFYVSKESTNTTESTWTVSVSSDGSDWTTVGDGQSATSMSKGVWVEVTRDLSNYSNVYVKIAYAGSTAVRAIDDIIISPVKSVEGVSLNKSTTTIEIGDTELLTAIFDPVDATNQVVSWKSSDDDVATVSSTGLVTAVAKGAATITVTTGEGDFTASCMVTVINPLTPTVTLDFTDNTDWEFPTTKDKGPDNFTDGQGYTINLDGNGEGYYFVENDNVLLLGKNGATLTLPAFPFNVSKIKVQGTDTGSQNVIFNIYVGDEAVSTVATSAKLDHEFAIASNKQNAGTVYVLKVTNDNNTRISKIEVFGYENVPVGKAGFATYCSPNALDFSDVTAYQAVMMADGKTVNFTKVDKVPDNTGVLVEGAKGAESTYKVPVVDSSSTDVSYTDVSNNKLVGVTEEKVIGMSSDKGTHYVLKQIGENVGFYQVNNAAYKVRANSAYLALTVSTGGTGAKDFIPVDGTTAIELVDTANEVAAPVYNLQGQRVSNGYKGVVIVNGKKVIR